MRMHSGKSDMASVSVPKRTMMSHIETHIKIIGALMMRETVTRYGRQGLGLLWLIGEPLLFCFGVILMWSLIKPPYEHGIRIAAFVMTGYSCLLLLRHLVAANLNALQANVGLLYHRKISVLHIYASRCALEILSTTLSFIVVYFVLVVTEQMTLPDDPMLLYGGWLLLSWIGVGLALCFAGLALRSELFERIAPLLSYGLIPLSGVFVMMAWLPPHYRDAIMAVPIVHAVEMVRGGVFGSAVKPYYNLTYAIAWAAGLTLAGLLLIAPAKKHVDLE